MQYRRRSKGRYEELINDTFATEGVGEHGANGRYWGMDEGRVKAMTGVRFQIAGARSLISLGIMGVGKTTTVESTIGLTEPDGGVIEICGWT